LSFAKKTSRRRRETDSLTLQRIQSVDLALERGVNLVGAKQFCSGDPLALARIAIGRARRVERGGRGGGTRARFFHGDAGVLELAVDGAQRIAQLRAFESELLDALRELVAFAARPFAIDLDAARPILQLPEVALGLIQRGAHRGDRLAGRIFLQLPLR